MSGQMGWFTNWLLRTYLLDLATQGSALTILLLLFGVLSQAEAYFHANRGLVVAVLVIHFTLHLIAALATVDAEALKELRRRHLDDDGD